MDDEKKKEIQSALTDKELGEGSRRQLDDRFLRMAEEWLMKCLV